MPDSEEKIMCDWLLAFINQKKKKQWTIEKVKEFINDPAKDPLRKDRKPRKPREGPSAAQLVDYACELLDVSKDDLKCQFKEGSA